jgi:hypothetical protein
MTKENFTNFATTTLVTSSLTTGSTSFVVSSGQGALFPTKNFAITMDTEIMFITSRSTDTFTVGTRGFDGSTAATHTSGATIQLCTIAYNYNHLWQNVADTFTPQVPPSQLGGSASSYDHEFEVGGNALWTLFPSSGLPAGTTFSVGTPLSSHLLLDRASSDTANYTAYVPFTGSPPFVITAKLSQGANFTNTTGSVSTDLFVSDQTNPTASPDSGNRVRLDAIISTGQTATFASQPLLNAQAVTARFVKDVSGTGSQVGSYIFAAPVQPLYLRIACASSYVWTMYLGDGITYWPFATTTFSFSVQTIGFSFQVGLHPGTSTQTSAIDYLRVVTSTFPTTYGS